MDEMSDKAINTITCVWASDTIGSLRITYPLLGHESKNA